MRLSQKTIVMIISVFACGLFFVADIVAAEGDYNFDGTSDVLFQNSSDGRLLIWAMNNFARTVKFPRSLASSWDVAGEGDFNGDGTSDVLYMKDTGDTAIAVFDNASRSSLKFPGGINTNWVVQGVGDFNGDGTDDILWQRSTDHVTMIWGMSNSVRNTISFPGGLSSLWVVAGVGDFNNDGTDDILFQHSNDGRLLIWQLNNYVRTNVKFAKSLANTWSVTGVGDFNADGTDDVFYLNEGGNTAIAEFSNLNRSALKFPGGINTVWKAKDVGDYNGDGTDDIIWRRSTDHITMIWGVKNSARNNIKLSGGLAAQWVICPGEESPPALTPPAAPSGLSISNLGTTSATLNWIDNSDNETSFEYGYYYYASFNVVGTVGANKTSVNITNLQPGTSYTFYVRAVNSAGKTISTGKTFTTSVAQKTVTLKPLFDNLAMTDSLDSSVANTVYQNGELAVGCNWDYGYYTGSQHVCGASTLYFDAGSKVSGKTIDSAVLELTVNYTGVGYYPQNWFVAALASGWNSNTMTWNVLAGMSYHLDTKQAYNPPAYSGQVYRLDLTSTVQKWADGGSNADNGLTLQSTNYAVFPYIATLDAFAFYSKEDSLSPPTLTITYH